ncbi:hypothetical protein H0H93_011658 [Arthromyces matolae]|nr:hypothetical protein H0H93_011658 [Arthromyces matolae]
MNGRTFDHGVEHLACFLPGLLALGAHTIPEGYLSPENRQRHKWAAEGLAYTCYLSYADQLSGLGPDTFHMQKGTNWLERLMEWETSDRAGKPPGLKEDGPKLNATERDYTQGFSSSYLLRPETVESLYVLWKTTGDEKWRERGYEIFSSIEKYAKTEYGYASINYVDSEQAGPIDDMPRYVEICFRIVSGQKRLNRNSFFLAETLKYLFLLFDEGDPYPLSKWVLNTEAHPLPVFEWSPWERTRYNITT